MCHRSSVVKGSVFLLALTGVVGTVTAQSFSTSSVQNNWDFYLDASSPGSDLSATDVGDTIFNLANSSPAPYTYTFGTGIAVADVNGLGFNSSNWSGVDWDYGEARSGASGGGYASIGVQSVVDLKNEGTSNIILDYESTLFIMFNANAYGTYNGTLNSISGMIVKTPTSTANYWGQNAGSYFLNVGTAWYGYELYQQGNNFSGFYYSNQLTLAPGQTDSLTFYSETFNIAPTPSSACTLLFGLGGLALWPRRERNRFLRRRRSPVTPEGFDK